MIANHEIPLSLISYIPSVFSDYDDREAYQDYSQRQLMMF